MEMFKFNSSSSDLANPIGNLIKSATEPLLHSPDWSKNLEICDMISRNKECPEQAMKAILRRMKDSDQNTVYLSLVIAETCMKNCGQNFAICVHQKIFLDELINIAKGTKGTKNSDQALNLIQQWGRMYERNQRDSFPMFFDTFLSLKSKGFLFPKEEPLPPISTSQELERRPFMRKSTSENVPVVSPVKDTASNKPKTNNNIPSKSMEQLEIDLHSVTERNLICQEMLLVSPGIEQDELLKELIGFLEACRDRMIDLIEAGTQGLLSEELFALVFKVNDDILKTLDAEKSGNFSEFSVSNKKMESSKNLIDMSTPTPSDKELNPSDNPFNDLVSSQPISSSEKDINPFDNDPFITKPIDISSYQNTSDIYSNQQSTLPPVPPVSSSASSQSMQVQQDYSTQGVVDDSLTTKQTLPQAPALDELDLMLSSSFNTTNFSSNSNSQQPQGITTSSNDVDIDKFFESLQESSTS